MFMHYVLAIATYNKMRTSHQLNAIYQNITVLTTFQYFVHFLSKILHNITVKCSSTIRFEKATVHTKNEYYQ